MHYVKKTKILITLGPATDSKEVMIALANAGMNGARLNFSHGLHAEHKRRIEFVRVAEETVGKPLAVVCDLQGFRVRIGKLNRERLYLEKNAEVVLCFGKEQTDTRVPLDTNIFHNLSTGDVLFINNAVVKLKVKEVSENQATCEVFEPGEILSHKGVNFPGIEIGGNFFTEKDRSDLTFALEEKIDYVAASFVQTGRDIQELRNFLAEKNAGNVQIISKIECKAAIKNLEEIVKESDMVMIARGDLAIEIGQEEVPIVQRKILSLCRQYRKQVIMATQMLESMIENPEPTRAEVNDVASAVFSRVDAVMLSAETAVGKYPVQTVEMMEKICKRVGQDYHEMPLEHARYDIIEDHDQTTAIASSIALLSHQLRAKIIFVFTTSGRSARAVSSFRPKAPIIAVSDSQKAYHQLALQWGVLSYFFPKLHDVDHVYSHVISQVREHHFAETGDKAVLMVGMRPGISGNTNIIRVMEI